MKIIGLIGGITPQSTILYYEILNELTSNYLGEFHSAKVIIHSVDFGIIKKYQNESRWDLLDKLMSDAGKSLELAGADCILICANTMHLCIDAIKGNVTIPVIHIAEATSKEIIAKQLSKVALLGTKYTMQKTFYKDVLKENSITTLIPNSEDQEVIHNIIYKELSKGILNSESRKEYQRIITNLKKEGVEGVILGCTEIPLLIKQSDVDIPVFDTTKIHATAAFNFAINSEL